MAVVRATAAAEATGGVKGRGGCGCGGNALLAREAEGSIAAVGGTPAPTELC